MAVLTGYARRTASLADSGGSLVDTIYTGDGTIDDIIRNVYLYGNSGSDKLRFRNPNGNPILNLVGDQSFQLLSDNFASTGGGTFQNGVIGSTTKPVVLGIYLDNLTYAQYRAMEIFSGSNILHRVDSRGFFYWKNQNNNSYDDVTISLVGNTERIVTTAYNLNLWQKHFAAYAEGSINAVIDSMGSNTSPQGGRIILSNGSGTAKMVLSANRTHGAAEPTWFGEGAQVGGTRGSINASALLDLQSTTQGLGLPNMTTAQKTAISTPRNGLLVYDTTLGQISYYNGTWINL